MRAEPVPSRRGMSFAVSVFVVLVLAGIGFAMSMLARHSSRTSHWFYHAQLAYDLADAALKQAASDLARYNSEAAAGAATDNADAYARVFAAVKAGAAAEVPLFSSRGKLASSLQTMLQEAKEYGPQLEVAVRVIRSEPLWNGVLEGVPAHAGERKGAVQIVSSVHVKTPVGTALDRVLTMQMPYKVINPTVPLLGRFSLFVKTRGTGEVNVVPMTFKPDSGDAQYEGAVLPIQLASPALAPAVQPGTNVLDRAAFVAALPKEGLLDTQGWVYLGGESGRRWNLHLAHGYGPGGESPLLVGRKRRELFHGSKSEDDAFNARYKAAFDPASAKCDASFTDPLDGLYLMQHGFASNYEQIGISPHSYYEVREGERRIALDYPVPDTSGLRLFGSADALSPTLVFGPVYQAKLQRAALRVNMGPTLECPYLGTNVLNFFKLDDVPELRPILLAAYGSAAEYEKSGSGLLEGEPFATALNVVLNAKGSGAYAATGILEPAPGAAAQGRTFTSRLLPWLGTLPRDDGMPPKLLTRMRDGELDSEAVYTGNLFDGLESVVKVLAAKATFAIQPDAFRKRIFTGGTLRIPGVALVDQNAPLAIGAVSKVTEGGVLIARGPIEVKGNIARAGKEPLALVALSGDVTVDSSVTSVDALLVSLKGAVHLNGPCTVAGLAAHDPDLAPLTRTPGLRTIKYSPDMDPTGPNATLLRAYYGGDEQLTVSGGTAP
jgi:hypothetical protein